jgi:hypothetical protein
MEGASGACAVRSSSGNCLWHTLDIVYSDCPPLSCGPPQVWNAGQAPAGVSIDNLGKPWATSITSCEAVRLNPTTNAVDLDSNGNQVRTYLGAGAYPYNYGDMTGTSSG